MRDSLMDDEGHSTNAPKKQRFLFTLFWIALGAGIATAIVLVVEHNKDSNDNSNCPSGPVVPPYNPADYDRLDSFYSNFTSVSFTQLDNVRADRVGAGVPNPVYARLIVYTRTQYYLPDGNASTTTLWINILSSNITNIVNISKPFQLTQPRWSIQDQSPQWTNDGKSVLFLSNRNDDSTSQLYHIRLPDTLFTDYIPLNDVITTTTAFTKFPISIDNFLLSPTNDVIAISVQVYPYKNMSETVAIQQKQQASGVESQLYDKLYMRHWDEWFQCRPLLGCLRNHPHLLSITLTDSGVTVHDVKDVLYGIDSDSPVRPFGGIEQWSFNSRGRIFAFTRQQTGDQETTTVAFNTDLNVHTIAFDITNTSQLVLDEIVCRTCDNPAEDTNPSFAPGWNQSNILAYLAMKRPKYESDRLRVRVLDLSSTPAYQWNVTENEDNSYTSLTWQPPAVKGGNSTLLYLGTESYAQDIIYTVDIYNGLASVRLWLPTMGSVSNAVVSPDGKYLVHTWSSMTFPPTLAIYTFATQAQTIITSHNDIWLQKVKRVEGYTTDNIKSIVFPCSNGDQCHGWLMKPLNFDPTKKYPMALLIHGGPQGAWVDSWSYRWNPQNYATFNNTNGFVTVMINPHGSTGYGQAFTDSIVGRYGSWPFQDLTQYGMNYVLSNFTFIDPTRVVALGASYGGYMINWIAGQPEATKFKALVSHDGMFDIRSFYYSTEEVYFPEHDNELVTPYQNLTKYEEWSPVNYVANWTQPMLVIHGGHDYRIPEAQGISVYTATQRLGIQGCQFLYFPKENHWVLKNANSVFWHQTVLAFISNHTQS